MKMKSKCPLQKERTVRTGCFRWPRNKRTSYGYREGVAQSPHKRRQQQRAIRQQHRSCPGQRTIGSLLQPPRQRAQGSPRRSQGASSNVEIANRPATYRKFQV
ncbi:hypothetical protein I7I48_01965 [Histoplasma ohiense]|nr:hypothetical protein I7I48_01965 [Histoplasma ohiense (nom. inval.)]